MSQSSLVEGTVAIELNSSTRQLALSTIEGDPGETPHQAVDDEYPSGLRLYIVFLALALSVLVVGLVSMALLHDSLGFCAAIELP